MKSLQKHTMPICRRTHKTLVMMSGLFIAAVFVLEMIFLSKYSQQTTFQSALQSPLSINDTPRSDPYALARSQSFGFFENIEEERWRLHQKIYQEYTKHKIPELPLR